MVSMDELTISPGHPLYGSLSLPGDKSLSHRAALLASLAKGESIIENFLVAGVTQVMLNALAELGVAYHLDGTVLTIISPGIAGWQAPAAPLDCGNSATTMRLLVGALAAAGVPAVLGGSSGLCRRPMQRIIDPLKQMGVPIVASPSNYAPLILEERPTHQLLHPLDYILPVASAQVKSCLLLAGLSARGKVILHEPAPSRDHTERLLNSMGLNVESHHQNGEYVTVLMSPPAIIIEPFRLSLPGDFSSAAFLIVAALITPDSKLTLRNVGLNPTRTGLLDVLAKMGARIDIHPGYDQGGEPVGDLVVNHSNLYATAVSGSMVVRMIDEFPAFAIAAAFAEGLTVVQDAAELRSKESDRIHSLVSELCTLGIKARESSDGFSIKGGELPISGRVGSHNDHRLAMALALVGLAGSGPVTVDGAGMITESFPEFPQALLSLGADIQAGRIP
jgi:3-phosphoshikimate 1-carboxyvinyltransferase